MSLAPHQRSSIPPAVASIMRETMRSSISTTVSVPQRLASASRMMQPMKPAPISTTWESAVSRDAIPRQSARVQQLCTPGRSRPGTGGWKGVAPVASSRRS